MLGLNVRIKTEFEPFTQPRLTLDTGRPLAESVRQAEPYLELIAAEGQ